MYTSCSKCIKLRGGIKGGLYNERLEWHGLQVGDVSKPRCRTRMQCDQGGREGGASTVMEIDISQN